MGQIKRNKRTFEFPKKKWDKTKLIFEKELVKKYGLKNKKELYVLSMKLKKARKAFKNFSNENKDFEKEELIQKYVKLGLLKKDEFFLDITQENFLNRRLQTIVFMNGFAKTILEARQKITHKKIKIFSKIKKYPGEIISSIEEKNISLEK